jgi:hypothetical protein
MKRLFYKEKIHSNDIYNNIFHGEGDKFSVDILVELFLKDEFGVSTSPLLYNASQIIARSFDHSVFGVENKLSVKRNVPKSGKVFKI